MGKHKQKKGNRGNVPSRELSAEQVKECKKAFAVMDRNKDGRLSRKEFMDAICVAGMNPTQSEREEIMNTLDTNNDGFIDFNEFMKLMKEYYIEADIESERMREAFAILDTDKDGAISLEELKAALLKEGSGIEESDVIELFKDIDTDGSGKIEYDEFINSTFCKSCL